MAHHHEAPPPRPHADHGGCDHDCANCGAPPVAGLAACKYCDAAYPGVEAGVTCPACGCISVKDRTACGDCNASLTRTCVFCGEASPLDRPQCVRCREPFEGAEERKRARGAVPTPHNADPTGAGIFNSLHSILKS